MPFKTIVPASMLAAVGAAVAAAPLKPIRYQRCPAHQGGLSADATVKIWRGGR